MRSPLALAASALLWLALPAHAYAFSPTHTLELHEKPAGIVGGQPSQVCAWPNVVAMRGGGLCTGTLIHPRVVAYAAHCGTFHGKVLFGEDMDAPTREVDTLYCERKSNIFAVSPEDYAFCVLAEPVEDIAITPPITGCDEDLVEIGTLVTIVGFGDTSTEDPQQVGIKHEAQTSITGMLQMIGVGGMGTGADSGDSGGPAFVQLDDGSWHLIGIVSGGGGDGATVQYVPTPLIIEWIEDQSGIDITPCHDAQGAWAPTPACEGFFVATEPGATWAGDGGGSCPSLRSDPSERCGPPWTEIVDSEGPQVSFTNPLAEQNLLGPPSIFNVLAEADDLDGVGVQEVRLRVDGQPWLDDDEQPAVDQVPPYRFEQVRLDLPGSHELELEAIDALGNASVATITVYAGDSGDSGSEDSGSEDSGGPSESSSTGSEASGDDTGEPGCGCSSSRDGRGELPRGVLVLGLLLWGLGRHTRPR